MTAIEIPMVGGSNEHRSVIVSVQLNKNVVVEQDVDGNSVHGRPGLESWTTIGSGEARGSHTFGDDYFVVVTNDLHKIDTDGVDTTVGTINTTTGPVIMAHNPTQMMLVDGLNGYIWNGSALAVISDAQYPDKATHVAFLDTYFIVNDPDNKGLFAISDPNDGTAWTGTEVATAERDPDPLQAIAVNGQDVWLIGLQSSEVWNNTGHAIFPFVNNKGGITEWGTRAPYSVAQADGALFWLGHSPRGHNVVLKSQGIRGTRVSTSSIEAQLNALTTITDAVAFVFVHEGHKFYVLTFPTEALTLVYDDSLPTEIAWSEWSSYGIGRWRPSSYTFFDGQHTVGDYQDGNQYHIKFTKYSDNGTVIQKLRRDRVLFSNTGKKMRHGALVLELETGVGDAGTDPVIMLRFSDNGGRTWSNEKHKGAGKVGMRGRHRVKFERLGRSRNRIYEVSMSDNYKFALKSMILEARI